MKRQGIATLLIGAAGGIFFQLDTPLGPAFQWWQAVAGGIFIGVSWWASEAVFFRRLEAFDETLVYKSRHIWAFLLSMASIFGMACSTIIPLLLGWPLNTVPLAWAGALLIGALTTRMLVPYR